MRIVLVDDPQHVSTLKRLLEVALDADVALVDSVEASRPSTRCPRTWW